MNFTEELMIVDTDFKTDVTTLIDNLKGICASYGLGNDGNEFKIITQVFLYKFLNDKFAYEIKKLDETIAKAEKWDEALAELSEEAYEYLVLQLDADTAVLKPHHFISHLFSKQNTAKFSKLFDDTLTNIAVTNSDIFSVKTEGGTTIRLFGRISEFVADKREGAILNRAAFPDS